MTDGDFWALVMAFMVAQMTTNGIFLILLIASGLIWLVPRLFIPGDNKELSAEELTAVNPSLAWIGKGYPFFMGLSLLLVITLIYVAANIWFKDRELQVWRLTAIWATFLSIADSLIVLCTGVYPMPTSKVDCRYVYEDGMRLRRIGLYQLIFAVALTAAAIISVFL